MECVKNPQYNCAKDGPCPNGYECCMQYGNEQRLGLCVKEKNCDRVRGIPKKGCRDLENQGVLNGSVRERFIVTSREGYDSSCNCSDWNKAFFVIFIVVTILALLAACWYISKK